MAQRLMHLVQKLIEEEKREKYQEYLDREIYGFWEPVDNGTQVYYRNPKTGEIREEKP